MIRLSTQETECVHEFICACFVYRSAHSLPFVKIVVQYSSKLFAKVSCIIYIYICCDGNNNKKKVNIKKATETITECFAMQNMCVDIVPSIHRVCMYIVYWMYAFGQNLKLQQNKSFTCLSESSCWMAGSIKGGIEQKKKNWCTLSFSLAFGNRN